MNELANKNLNLLGNHDDVMNFLTSEKYENLVPARVISEHRGGYRVHDGEREYDAVITGKRNFTATSRGDYPAIGDWVGIEILNEEQSVIRVIIPRKTVLERKRVSTQENQIIAANVDMAFIVEAIGRDFNFNRIERYMVLAQEGGITPVIIFNKIDLLGEDEVELILDQAQERFPAVDIFAVSATEKSGLDEIDEFMQKEKTYSFIGSSGAGKSSLINCLLGDQVIKTKAIGESASRGVHTTTSREMYFLENGAIVIDNPGMREVGVTVVDEGVRDVFVAIDELSAQCKFRDCTHQAEPACAVQNALSSGDLDQEMYENYTRLKKESDYSGLSKFEKRRKDKQFGKHVKSVMSQKRKR